MWRDSDGPRGASSGPAVDYGDVDALKELVDSPSPPSCTYCDDEAAGFHLIVASHPDTVSDVIAVYDDDRYLGAFVCGRHYRWASDNPRAFVDDVIANTVTRYLPEVQ